MYLKLAFNELEYTDIYDVTSNEDLRLLARGRISHLKEVNNINCMLQLLEELSKNTDAIIPP